MIVCMTGMQFLVIWVGCTKGWSGELEGCRVCYSTESFKATKTSNKEEMAVLLRYGRFLAAILASSKVHFPEFSFISFLCLCPCLCLFEYLWLCLMKGSCPDVRCCTHRTPTKISNLRLSLSCYIYTLRQIAWHCMIQYFMHWTLETWFEHCKRKEHPFYLILFYLNQKMRMQKENQKQRK